MKNKNARIILLLIVAVVVVAIIYKKRDTIGEWLKGKLPDGSKSNTGSGTGTTTTGTTSPGGGTSPGPASTPQADTFPLHTGSKGPHVIQLQKNLNKFLSGAIAEDGAYGPQTATAASTVLHTNGTVFNEKEFNTLASLVTKGCHVADHLRGNDASYFGFGFSQLVGLFWSINSDGTIQIATVINSPGSHFENITASSAYKIS